MEDRPEARGLIVVLGPPDYRFQRRHHARFHGDDEWIRMTMQERDARRRQEGGEEEHRHPPVFLGRPPPLRRGIVSFHQENFAFGYDAKFSCFSMNSVPGLEQVAASPDFDTQRLFLKRVTACVGWAVHGLIFELCDNSRIGCILSGGAEERMELSDENMKQRHQVEWHTVEYGDYIVGIHGNQLHDPSLLWFCQTCVLEFASGSTIRFEASHEPWRGKPFSWHLPPLLPCLVYRVTFRHEQSQDMRGVVTSIHLPLSAGNLPYLPNKHQRTVQAIRHVLTQVDHVRESRGFKALHDDLWWNILGWIRAWEMPVVENDESSAVTDPAQDNDLIQQFENLSTG